MKGTLYSADFVKTATGIKLLEFNTDTAFVKPSVDEFDFSPFGAILTTNNINTVNVIYKPSLQQSIVDGLKAYLTDSHPTIVLELTEETAQTIYPTDVTDADDKFILRLAYNESAIFDSEYCKNTINLYKLMLPQSGSDETFDTVKFYYSSSEDMEYDYIDNSLNYDAACPDLMVRHNSIDTSNRARFYKLGHSSASAEVRIDEFIEEMRNDGTMITNYIDTSNNTDYMKSIRMCNILYGSNLDNITIYAKTVDALLDKPKIVEDFVVDDTKLYTEYHVRHLFELATNHFKYNVNNQDGLGSDVEISSGSIKYPVYAINVGDVCDATHIPGLPNSDNMVEIYSWSLDGNTLPTGSFVTSSTLVSKTIDEVEFGVLNEIVIESGSFLAGPALPILVYDSGSDSIQFTSVAKIDPSIHSVFDATGTLVPVVSNNFFVLAETDFTHTLDFETNDTFLINETNVRIITHNINYNQFDSPPAGFYCFIAGTKVTMDDGTQKNIEDILPGDSVLTFNDELEGNTAGIVGDTAFHEVTTVVKIILEDGVEITTTPEHPFAASGDGWKKAGELVSTDFLRKSDGSNVNIASVEILEETHIVYNLHNVETSHTFYVNDILVHNK